MHSVGVVVLQVSRKLTCSSSFCNVGGCKAETLMKLGYIRGLYLKSLSRTILQKFCKIRYHLVRPVDVSNRSVIIRY